MLHVNGKYRSVFWRGGRAREVRNLPAGPRRSPRFHLQQGAVIFLPEHIQQTIRTLPNVANAVLQLVEHRLGVKLLPLIVEVDWFQLAGPRHFALSHPAREQIVSIERGPPRHDLRTLVNRYVSELLGKLGAALGCVILGCTHYSLIADLFVALCRLVCG
jgi:hypothetical protein